MYLSNFCNVFVQVSKRTCPNWKMYLSKFQYLFVQNWFLTTVLKQLGLGAAASDGRIAKCICPICLMYLSKFPNELVRIWKCICLSFNIYLSRIGFWQLFWNSWGLGRLQVQTEELVFTTNTQDLLCQPREAPAIAQLITVKQARLTYICMKVHRQMSQGITCLAHDKPTHNIYSASLDRPQQ